MMHLAIDSQVTWKFESIPEEYESEFVASVLSDYLYSDDQVIELSDSGFSAAYNAGFQDSYYLYELGVGLELYPDVDWDGISDEKSDELNQHISEEATYHDYTFLHDLLMVLDAYQLFYIKKEWHYMMPGPSENIYMHSPLQEVW